MNLTRKPTAGGAMVLALTLVVLAGCSGTSGPGNGRSPQATGSTVPTATATVHPTTLPSTAAPGPTTIPPSSSSRVLSSAVTYPWHWPNDVTSPCRVTHTYPVPPVPELVQISVGDHPSAPDGRAYNRMSFTFTTAFPSYRVEFTDHLVADPRGDVVPLHGLGVLTIVFTGAQAHTSTGASSIASQPAAWIGFSRMLDYARAGADEGVLTYGIGIAWPIATSNPQIPVRVYEVHQITAAGTHEYVVAVDIASANPVVR
jgi:hypothetical protein